MPNVNGYLSGFQEHQVHAKIESFGKNEGFDIYDKKELEIRKTSYQIIGADIFNLKLGNKKNPVRFKGKIT